jgi:RNA polymerase-binding transcription factor DksA
VSEPRAFSELELATIRETLRAELAATQLRLGALERAFDELVAAADLEPPDDEHDPDGTTAYERAQVRSLAAEARAHLAQLARAVDAIEHGRYGRCITCGRPIGAERLAALPGAGACVTCASGGRPAT